ncbi:IS630 family transposase [Streptosporangium fragile]|uniref:IS630 family transposase n=1 Tax=Streptosporangium fragile TaxID=46186 RepID=A0ABN3W5R5_9ACTN
MVLTDRERQTLQRWQRATSTPQALALRSRIVLACAETDDDGLPRTAGAVARQVGVTPETVRKWRARFVRDRLDGLGDAPRPGRARTVSDEQVTAIVRATLQTRPTNATHWSTRAMAAKTGLSQSTISRIWRAFGLQPHRSRSFTPSTGPVFADRVHDVIGLYLDPPERVLAVCVAEKAQIQALDRAQPVLPMMPGVPERRSHDHVRPGTTALFAALDAATGTVIGSPHRRHRTIEFKKFLAKLDREVPADLQVHLICDDYGTYTTEAIKKWLPAHPRLHLHVTPTGSSWPNLVERWFAEPTAGRLHHSAQALERDIRAWIADGNDNPRPYAWAKTSDEILQALASYCRRIKDSGHC